jgi:LysM repeat protein
MDHAAAAPDAPRICPFLHAGTAAGTLGDPILWPDEANRCTALGDAAPQSLRQQEYACLASSHVNCPRFARGVHLMADTPPPTAGAGLQMTPAVLAALLVLALSFALSVGFVVANGGMDLPVAPGGSASPQAALASGEAGETATPSGPEPASGDPSIEPSAVPSAESSVEAATAAPTAAPTATPTPVGTPTPSPTSAPTSSPAPSSNRYALLEPCGDAPDCWIYTVRSGDNLVSIARYFGVPLDTVTKLNPWTKTTQLVAGQELRLPPPTR